MTQARTYEAWLRRNPSTPWGVQGDFWTDSGFSAKSNERPWVDNLRGVSCIPPGRYLCRWQWSPKHNRFLYHLVAVPDRDVIEMHSANVFEELLGCIALGSSIAQFAKDAIRPGLPSVGMPGVVASVDTMRRFHADMLGPDGRQQDFWLNVQWRGA